jgi:hypothetical protein
MKKIALFVMAAAAVIATSSCEKINDFFTGKTTDEKGLVDDNGKKLSPDQQKTKIDETADALMTDLDKSAWQNELDTVNSVLDEMGDKEIDSKVIEEHMNAIIDAWISVTGEDPYTTTTTLAKLSDIKGHYTENKAGGFDFEEANDLQVTIVSGGKNITATFAAEVSDAVITVSERYTQDANGRTEEIVKAYVPKKAALGLLVNGSTLASLEIRLNYADVNNDGYADEGDKADLGYTMKVGVYTLTVDQADYATDKASVKMSFKKDGKLVVGAEANAAFKIESDQDGEFMVPISAKVNVDLEGKMQFVGTIPSYDVMVAAEDKLAKAQQANDYNAFSAALAELEKAYGFGVYYDGKNTLQATLGLEPYKYEVTDEDVNGDGQVNEQDHISGFGANPVIRFQDGTSYTAEEYFSQERFGSTAEKVTKWATDILEALGLNQKSEVVTQK